MKKSTFTLTDEQLLEIEKCFETENVIELKRICTELEIKLGEIKTFDTMSYKLLECIESNDELVKKLRELSKERKALRKLFPYYQKSENVRYFVDNKDEYQLIDIDLKKIEEKYTNGVKNNKSWKLDKQYNKREKFWKKHGFKIAVIFELLLIMFTYNIFIKQYFMTSIIKKANITDAVVLKDERKRFTGGYLIANWKVKYEYNVDNRKYENTQRTQIVGYNIFQKVESDNKVKIYYEKNNPLESKIYQYGGIWNFFMICHIAVCILLFIKLITWRR